MTGTNADLIAKAENAIGADDPDADWQLKPKQHAAALPPEAGVLARALNQPQIQEIMDGYGRGDEEAVAAQARYKRWSRLAVWARLGAIVIGAAFVLPLLGVAIAGYSLASLAIAGQYACLALAFLITAYINRARLFARWMEARAEAEIRRLALFDYVAAQSEPAHEGELPLLPLQLEYFRRYQLEVQRRYYHGRGGQHARAAGQSQGVQRLLNLLGLVALAPIVIVMLELFGIKILGAEMISHALLAFGIVVSGVFAAIAAISQVNLDERNAARYAVVAQNLDDLAETQLAPARAAAAEGEAKPMRDLIAAAHRLISSEHQEWLSLRKHVPRPEETAQFVLEPTRIGLPPSR